MYTHTKYQSYTSKYTGVVDKFQNQGVTKGRTDGQGDRYMPPYRGQKIVKTDECILHEKR